MLKHPKGDRAFVEMLLIAREVGLDLLVVATGVLLDTVDEDSTEQSWTATISADGDRDFFVLDAEEGTAICIPGTAQSYTFRVRLVPPQGADCRDYDLYLYDDAGTLIDSSENAGCLEEAIIFGWVGECGLNDSLSFIAEVRPQPGEFSCSPYTLYADMWSP